MQLYGNPQLTGKERFFDVDEVIVSKTDMKGIITYANRTFSRLAGLSTQESVGKPHNIIRHPHMPRCVFKLLWDTLASGNEVFAYVLNRSINGDHYWVLAHVTPSFNMQGDIVGYHSNRRVPNREIVDGTIAPLYQQVLELEQSFDSPKQGLAAGFQEVVNLIGSSGKEYNEFILSLGDENV